MERPERRMGIREMEEGVMVVVVYSYPRGVLAVGPLETVSPAAVASHPIINEISLTRALVSRVLASLDRNCESLAWRHG